MTDPSNEPTTTAGRWRRIGKSLATLWQRFLQGPEMPGARELPVGRLTERRAITPIAVPARGFAFNFQVYGVFVWTSEGLGRPVLQSLVGTFLPYARGHLKSLAGDLARRVEPHRCEDFEGRLRHRLAELGEWTYKTDGRQVSCRAHVRVEPDERLRESIRPYWERLIELDYERDIATRKARHADGVSTQWAAILKKLLAAPEAGGAATMTDEQLAKVVREMLTERRTWEEAMAGLGPQSEYAREGFFDLLGEQGPAGR